MKKSAVHYSIIWLVCLVLFNVITFVTPSDIGNKFNAGFWVGYIFVTAAFAGHLACAMLALARKELKTTFYNLPLIHVSYTDIVLMLIVGGVCMAVPAIQYWVAIIACALILGIYIIAVTKASAAAALVAGVDARVAQTALMHQLTDEARSVMLAAGGEALHVEAKKVYEALRYADPTDHATLAELNWQIKSALHAFSVAVTSKDLELAAAEAQNLLAMLETRNMQLKALK